MSDRTDAETVAWRVEGMDCASCVAAVRTAVGRLPGVSGVEVNLMAERLTLLRAAGGAPPAAVEREVGALGYRVTRLAGAEPLPSNHNYGHDHACHGHDHSHDHGHDHPHPAEDRPVPLWRTGKARLVAALAGLVAAAWVASELFPRAAPALYLAATLLAVIPFGRRALALARSGTPFSIETLMVVAAVAAAAIGAAEEAAVVVLLFAGGELLEAVAAGQARAGIRALTALMPRTARRQMADGRTEEVSVAALRVGDTVQVRPGDRLPCDGTVLDGRSAVDESPVTGESLPVSRGPGDSVLAGSTNTDGVLRVRVTRAAADNTVARIVRLVEEASAARAPSQRFVERFARWWTPAAMVAAALTLLVPPLLAGGDWGTWAYRGLALLLIACPCALVISVPAAVASGLSAGARRGLLVKGGAALEAIGTARTVAFDKTGTLTLGQPRVTDVLPLPGADEPGLLALAAAVEAGSAHPLARAIVAAAAERGVAPLLATEGRAIPGRAAEATVSGRRVAVGSPRFAAEAGADLAPMYLDQAAALEAAGKTVVVVLADGVPQGLLALRDEPRADAVPALAALRHLGVDAVMLTGDNDRTGQAVAAALGLPARTELLPADKLREIAALRAGGPVLMVGDGINDAPALAAATVGIAMGGGTEVALETADAALLGERVTGVAELVALSRATLATIRQNVAVAIGLKAVFLVTTLIGLTGLWPAILADTGATVLVTLNALRLLRWRFRSTRSR